MEKKEKLSLEGMVKQVLINDEEKPYKIPENWVWTRLECVATWGSGGTPSRKVSEYYTGNIPWVKTGELNNAVIYTTEEKITQEAVNKSSAKLFPVNAIVIAMYGATIGKVAMLGVEATTNQACGCGVCLKCLYYKYLFYYALSQKRAFINKSKGGAQPNISQEVIKKHVIPIPPLPEQHRIVAVIESLFEKLDRAKELAQNALDSFENRKSAILHKAFTGELTREWREENGVDFERDWMEKALGKCGEWFGGGTPSKSHPQFWVDGNLLWVTPKDMKSVYIKDTEDKITEIALEKSSAKLIPNAAVLFVVRSGILRRILPIALTTRPVTVNQDMKAIIPRDIDIKFFYWYCLGKESDIRNKCAKNGTTVESISSDLLYKYEILVPPLKEQQEIVRILDNLLENEQKAKDLCDVIDKIDHMKKSILARAFRGELGTNKPEEESALKLLKEVLREKA